ncbi:uncharacterized protein LOC108913102 [Anoplophora glabripennis]|uniref:uncharacterized protein LOC108913102 n=1 Tax=Anoplophora glabripennis TaxID=217634 RepID=UPI000873A435|nr:uncharacterized protein LOC108913102 [Anoplophora glabripennis]
MQKCDMVVVLVYLSFGIGALEVTGSSLVDLFQTRHRRQNQEEGCVLPYYPEHGQWKLLNGEAKPGDKIKQSSAIKFECDSGYRLSSEYAYRVCDENWVNMRFPECDKLCPPLYPSTTFELQCKNKRGKEVKCSEATDGTYVEYTCASSYETPFGYKKALLCTEGKWNQRPVCHPVCGKKLINGAKPLIIGSAPSKKLEYPWVTALYRKDNNSYSYICGGSILSLTVIVTAAHCVTNEFGNTLPVELYLIGVGKLYSEYKASNDTRAQYLELFKIIVHEDYKGDNRRFLADIAVLVVKGEIVLTEVVQPVCFNNMKSIYLHPGSIGEVSGWGRTEDDDTSEILRTLKIPYKDDATCAEELPKEWVNKYSIVDKLCAGLFNKSTSVCDGDSGNGLAFLNAEDNRYYIHGIVSLGPLRDGHCDIQQNSLYTKVAFHYEFVDRLLNAYAPTVKDCVLPAHPKNGKWTTEKQDMKPGDAVPSSTVLKLECNKGFLLSSVSTNINCGSAHDMPVCQSLCPELKFQNGSNYRCTNKKGQTIDCAEAVDGSKLWYDCPRGYKPAEGTNNSTCINGSWGLLQPECLRPIKTCGKKVITNSNALTSDGKAEEGLEHPWNVNIYEKQNNSPLKDYTFVCGGSLISQKVVLTAGACISDHRGEVKEKEDYLIGAGVTYTKYNHPKDVHAQYSELTHIILHQRYKGESRRYLADIAVLVAKKPFTFNSFVQPVCFTDVDSILLRRGNVGVVLKYKDEEKQEALEIPYKEDEVCSRELPADFADRYYVLDKICAGYANRSSLCRGDSGKGYFVKNPEDNRYYVYGIVSISPVVEDKCHNDVLYTSVRFYYDFIDDILSRYK